MDILEVINFCKNNKSVTIPQLQVKFGINYKNAKSTVDKLITDGELAYDSGIRYNYVKKNNDAYELREDLDEENFDEESQAQFEARRREFVRRMSLRFNSLNDDDDEDNEDNGNEEVKEDDLRYKALKVCVERNMASVSMLQRIFPIGYIRACKIIEWMEKKGYVSPAVGSRPRVVLITKSQLSRILKRPD